MDTAMDPSRHCAEFICILCITHAVIIANMYRELFCKREAEAATILQRRFKEQEIVAQES